MFFRWVTASRFRGLRPASRGWPRGGWSGRPLGHVEDKRRDGLVPGDDQNARAPVYRRHADAQVSYDRLASDGPQESGHPLLGRDGEQEAGHLLCPPDRATRRERTSTAVGYERYFGREDRHERFQISGGSCFEEALGH